MWKGVRTVYLKAAFVEICLHGRGETVAATIYCQVRVLIHDEQLSSNARRICRMVAVPSSQIALFVMLVPGKKSWLSIVRKTTHQNPRLGPPLAALT